MFIAVELFSYYNLLVKYAVILFLVAAFFLLVFLYLEKNNPRMGTVAPAPTVLPTQSVKGIKSFPSSRCHSDGILPDRNCTPGVVDPSVTQDTIYQTICVSGYTKTVRPPASYTNKLKMQQIEEYGFIDTNPRDYEEDHLISLELGGSASDPKNLWPEPGASPNAKDSIENLCHKKVCSGQLKLTDAQRMIVENWQTACQ